MLVRVLITRIDVGVAGLLRRWCSTFGVVAVAITASVCMSAAPSRRPVVVHGQEKVIGVRVCTVRARGVCERVRVYALCVRNTRACVHTLRI